MSSEPHRPITHEEAAVIQTALERAPVNPNAGRLISTIPTLRVIDRCKCGCASVNFVEEDLQAKSLLLADATATTPSGGGIGVIVWGTASQITSLEIYDLGAGQDDLRLPDPASIVAW